MQTTARTTVTLPVALARRLTIEARHAGKAVSAVVREALEAHLGNLTTDLPAFAGIGKSGRSDISENVDKLIRRKVRRGR